MTNDLSALSGGDNRYTFSKWLQTHTSIPIYVWKAALGWCFSTTDWMYLTAHQKVHAKHFQLLITSWNYFFAWKGFTSVQSALTIIWKLCKNMRYMSISPLDIDNLATYYVKASGGDSTILDLTAHCYHAQWIWGITTSLRGLRFI